MENNISGTHRHKALPRPPWGAKGDPEARIGGGGRVTPDLRLSCPRRGWRREEQLYTCTAAAAAEAHLWSEAELHTWEGSESCRETEEA